MKRHSAAHEHIEAATTSWSQEKEAKELYDIAAAGADDMTVSAIFRLALEMRIMDPEVRRALEAAAETYALENE